MKITDYKNEEALDLLADIIEPTAKILADKELAQAVKDKASKLAVIKMAIKNHKPEVIEILARMEGKAPEDYSCNIITITAGLLDLLNDKELTDFFTLQGQSVERTSSTSATGNTEEKEA